MYEGSEFYEEFLNRLEPLSKKAKELKKLYEETDETSEEMLELEASFNKDFESLKQLFYEDK